MATILELKSRLSSLDIPSTCHRLNEKYSQAFLHANRVQMWNGMNPDGSEITPSYLDDPYFKTEKMARGYARWKGKDRFRSNSLYGTSGRGEFTPNLFINGYFYSTLTLNATELRIETNDALGRDIVAGHDKALGVSDEHLRDIANTYYLPDFYAYFSSVTGLQVK